MFQAISGGMMSVEEAARHTTAIRTAQAHLEELGITHPLQAGVQRGTDQDGFSWSIRITPLGSRSRGDQAGASGGLALFAVEVQVAWRVDRREKSVRLESYLLGQVGGASGTTSGEAAR